MSNIIYGKALSLRNAFELVGAEDVYLLDGWRGYDNGYRRINLGKNRIIDVDSKSFLIIIHEEKIDIQKIDFSLIDSGENTKSGNEPTLKMNDYLKRRGITAKPIPLKKEKLCNRFRNGWFSTCGYYQQDSSWLDCWTYACTLVLVKNQLVIDGKSVKSFDLTHSWWVDVDIWNVMRNEIENILSKKCEINSLDFAKILEKRGIMEIYNKYFTTNYYE